MKNHSDDITQYTEYIRWAENETMDEDQAEILAHDKDFARMYDLYPIEYMAEKFNLDALVVVKARYILETEKAHKYGLLSDDEVPIEGKTQ